MNAFLYIIVMQNIATRHLGFRLPPTSYYASAFFRVKREEMQTIPHTIFMPIRNDDKLYIVIFSLLLFYKILLLYTKFGENAIPGEK